MIKVLSKVRKEIQNKKIVEIKEYVNLVPELVSLTGMTNDQRADFNTMKTLAPFTKLNPEKRMYTCNKAANVLNKNN